MATDSVLLKHVAPAAGCLVAWAMFLSPLKAVLQVRKSKALGALNPLPLVAMWANCAGWLVYSFMVRDVYVLASNEPGLLLASFMTVTCYGFADEKSRDTMMGALLFFALVLSVGGAAISFGGMSHEAAVSTWGFVTVGILLIFYAAPLSSVAEVLRTRSSAALNEPLAAMAIINGGLWATYGWAVRDAFIWGPNLVGAVFGAFQVALCKSFPSKPPDSKAGGEEAPIMREMELGLDGASGGVASGGMGGRSFSFSRSPKAAL